MVQNDGFLGKQGQGWMQRILLGIGYYLKALVFVLGGGFIGAYCTINYS